MKNKSVHENFEISLLKPHPKNPKEHTDEQVKKLAKSIDAFDWLQPIVCDENYQVLIGHGRLLAAQKAGLRYAPVWVLLGYSEDEKLSLMVADNKLNMETGWIASNLDEILNSISKDCSIFNDLGFADLDSVIVNDKKDLNDKFEPPPSLPKEEEIKHGDLIELNEHIVFCGDSGLYENMLLLFKDRDRPYLMVTDPPYGVSYDPSWRNNVGLGVGERSLGVVENDDIADWSHVWINWSPKVIYCWHAGKYSSVVQKSLEDNGLKIISQIIWVKQHFALSRGDYHWQHEPCQPSGTLVQKVVKSGRWKEFARIEEVPIESLVVGDKVVSFGNAKIYKNGREIKRIGKRSYKGNLHYIEVGAKKTRATSEHKFTIRFDPSKAKFAVLYLMKRASRWRIGVCRLFNSRGFGAAVRLSQEKGEELWILSAHPNLTSARVMEQIICCSYGIPTTHWETNRQSSSNFLFRSDSEIDQIYSSIGIERIDKGVIQLMKDYGLIEDYPLIRSEEVGRFSRKQSRLVVAANLIPTIMQIPIPTNGEDFEWQNITSHCFESYEGEVFSMDVDIDQHYVADGIVTHNCWYASSSDHHWQGARDQSTVWEIKNNNAFGNANAEERFGHGTQKPIECMARPIRNNSEIGDTVADPFLGSGTTLIAADMLKRICIGAELSPEYCRLIVNRYKKYCAEKQKECVVKLNGEVLEVVCNDEM